MSLLENDVEVHEEPQANADAERCPECEEMLDECVCDEVDFDDDAFDDDDDVFDY